VVSLAGVLTRNARRSFKGRVPGPAGGGKSVTRDRRADRSASALSERASLENVPLLATVLGKECFPKGIDVRVTGRTLGAVHPIVTIPGVVKLLKSTKPTAGKAVQLLERLGVLTETSGKQRDRSFAYSAYLERLRAGTELEGR
jgi:hypothetical protein